MIITKGKGVLQRIKDTSYIECNPTPESLIKAIKEICG